MAKGKRKGMVECDIMMLSLTATTARWSAGLIGFDLMWPTNMMRLSLSLERVKIEINTGTGIGVE